MGGKIVHQAPGTGWCMLGYLWRFEEVVQQLVCCCRVQGQLSTVQFLQDFGHAICPQVYLYKMRKPELPVVERCCLNKHRGCHFLVEIFWLLGLFFFPQVINLGSIYLFFSSLRTSPLIFQPSSAVFSHAQVPHSGTQKHPRQTSLSEWSRPPILKQTQALLPGGMTLSSKITIPFASAAAAFFLEDISALPKLPWGWLNWQ